MLSFYPLSGAPLSGMPLSGQPIQDAVAPFIEDGLLSLQSEDDQELNFFLGAISDEGIVLVATLEEWVEVEQAETEFTFAVVDDDASNFDDDLIQFDEPLFAFTEVDEESLSFTFNGVIDDPQLLAWFEDDNSTEEIELDGLYAYSLPDDPTGDTHDPGPIEEHYLDWWRKKHEKPKRKPQPDEIEPEPEEELEIPIPAMAAPPENDDDDALALLMLME